MATKKETEAAAAEQAAQEAAAAEQAAQEAAAAEQAAQEAAAAELDVPDGCLAVCFVRSHEVQDEHRGTDLATVYKPNWIYVLPEGSARHFISRGIAVAV